MHIVNRLLIIQGMHCVYAFQFCIFHFPIQIQDPSEVAHCLRDMYNEIPFNQLYFISVVLVRSYQKECLY